MSRHAWPARALAAVALAALLSGCSLFRGATPDGQIPHPEGASPVLRVYTTGGFVPAEYQLTSLPGFTLLGDGRVIVPGAVAGIYPGPVLPRLLFARLNEAGIQAVLREVERMGQLTADRHWTGAQSYVADAPDTVFVLHGGGREVTVRVYALGLYDGPSLPIPSEEREAHRVLSELASRLDDLASWVPSTGWADPQWQPYEADAVRLLVRLADGDQATDGLPFEERPWPIDELDPAGFGEPLLGGVTRCGVVGGSVALDWYDALANATELTRWVQDGHRYQVSVRPLLPDEARDCAPAS